MASHWKVSRNPVGDETLYGVYRKIDENAIDHSGNREDFGRLFSSKAEAEMIAAKLNEVEGR